MTRKRQQRVLPVEEDDCIAIRKEVLGGGRATRSSGKVVDEAHGLFFERYGRSARGYEHHPML